MRNDNDYQDWEAEHIIDGLAKLGIDSANTENLIEHGTSTSIPMKCGMVVPWIVTSTRRSPPLQKTADAWAVRTKSKAQDTLKDYVASKPDLADAWVTQLKLDPVKAKAWATLKRDMDAHKMFDDYLATSRAAWPAYKIASYNKDLSGKIYIPQPFGSIRNGYERESDLRSASS